MTIPKDTKAAADALGQPMDALIDKLVFHVYDVVSDVPKDMSKRLQRRLAKALAYAEELESRGRRRKFTAPC